MILLRPIWVHHPRPLRHRYTSLKCRLSIWDEHRCDCLCKIKKLWRGGSIYGVVSFEEALSFGKVAVLVPLGGLGSGDLIWRLRTVVPLWRVPEFSCLLMMLGYANVWGESCVSSLFWQKSLKAYWSILDDTCLLQLIEAAFKHVDILLVDVQWFHQ